MQTIKKYSFEIIPGKDDIRHDDTADINKMTKGIGISWCNDDFWFKILRELK